MKIEPKVNWESNISTLYTLMMVDALDPDMPDPTNKRHILHWLISNIPGDDISKGETKS